MTITVDARLESTIKTAIDSQTKNLHTALPGKVISFDPIKQTVTVQPMIQNIYSEGRIVDIPPLINCPVSVLRAGGFSITYPIKAGDECLILFGERSIDLWFKEGSKRPPLSNHTHSLSDGFALLCFYSQPNILQDYNTDRLEIRSDNSATSITVGDDGTVEIKNATNSLLPILLTLLNTLATDGINDGVFKPLVNQSEYTTLAGQLSTLIP